VLLLLVPLATISTSTSRSIARTTRRRHGGETAGMAAKREMKKEIGENVEFS
jgi:hypothetical protein